MKKQFTTGKEKSSDKRLALAKEGMNRSMKERKADGSEQPDQMNKKCAIQSKTTFAKKDNLKKLSLAIATYFDAGKVGDRLPFPSSTKNEDSKGKKIAYSKYSSLADGQKAAATMPCGLDKVKKTAAGLKSKIEERSYTGVGRPGSISSIKAKRDISDFKADSYRQIDKQALDEKPKANLVREKTIPKFTTAGEKCTKQGGHIPSNSFILNSQNTRHVKGSSMFKACINSISKRIDNLPAKESRPKKAERSVNLNSLTLFSEKNETSTVKVKQVSQIQVEKRACLNELNAAESVKRSVKDEGKYLMGKYLHQCTTTNKENENSRINYSGHSLGRSRLRDSRQPFEESQRRVDPERAKEVSSTGLLGLKAYQVKQSNGANLLKQPSGEYDLSNDSSKANELYTSKIKKKSIGDSRVSMNSKSKQTASKLDIQKLHSRIRSNRGQRDLTSKSRIKSENVKADYSVTSSRKTIVPGNLKDEEDLLACEEAELRVSLRVEEHLIIDPQAEPEHMCTLQDISSKAESNTIIDGETLKQLLLSEKDYQFNPHYLETTGTNIKWNMRSILLNWIIEVSDDFGLKRSTFHYAANYIDRYLATSPNVPVKSLQLVGLTALDLATKLEEIFIPGLKDFALVALNNYTVEDIQKMELDMLKALKWRINPPTYYIWVNWYTLHWDMFIQTNPFATSHLLVRSMSSDKVTFRDMNAQSYGRYCRLMQLIDCAILEVDTLQYKTRPLVAAFMYIVIGIEYNQFTLETVVERFPSSSLYLLDPSYALNNLFGRYLEHYFGIELEELLPGIQFASSFAGLEVSTKLPSVAVNNKEVVAAGHFEDFLAYQSHHAGALRLIYQRRGVNQSG